MGRQKGGLDQRLKKRNFLQDLALYSEGRTKSVNVQEIFSQIRVANASEVNDGWLRMNERVKVVTKHKNENNLLNCH